MMAVQTTRYKAQTMLVSSIEASVFDSQVKIGSLPVPMGRVCTGNVVFVAEANQCFLRLDLVSRA